MGLAVLAITEVLPPNTVMLMHCPPTKRELARRHRQPQLE